METPAVVHPGFPWRFDIAISELVFVNSKKSTNRAKYAHSVYRDTSSYLIIHKCQQTAVRT